MKTLRSMAWRLAAVGLLLGAAGVGQAQMGTGHGSGGGQSSVGQSSTGQPSTGQPMQPTMPKLGTMGTDDSSPNPRSEEEMEKMRNSDRQKKLVADTERLLSLANELKADMDKTNKDMLSLDVVRKADEIEKLAHSVKERMKGQ